MRAKDIEVGGGRAVLAEGQLDRLAEDIRRHHKAVERHARKMVAEAIAAGEKLIEAKAMLPHGEFDAFRTRCGVSRSSAFDYRKLAREKSSAGVLEADSIREALRALAPKPKPKPKRPEYWDWFFKGPDGPGSRPPYDPVYDRSPNVELAERVLRENLVPAVGVRDGELLVELKRRDMGDPSVSHPFGPPWSCNEALREGLSTDELRALRALVDEALREREGAR
jgi:hypothetical protein